MMTGGVYHTVGPKANSSTELLSSNGTRLCSLLFPNKFSFSQIGLIVCGGHHLDSNCYTFSDGKLKKSHTLGRGRNGHAAWASPQGVLIIGGEARIVPNIQTTTKMGGGKSVCVSSVSA